MNTRQSDALFALIILLIAIILFVLALWTMMHYFNVLDSHEDTVTQLETNSFTPASQLQSLSKQVKTGNKYPNIGQSSLSSVGKTETFEQSSADTAPNPHVSTELSSSFDEATANTPFNDHHTTDHNSNHNINTKNNPANQSITHKPTINEAGRNKTTSSRDSHIALTDNTPMTATDDRNRYQPSRAVNKAQSTHSPKIASKQGELFFDCVNPANQQAQLILDTTHNDQDDNQAGMLVFYTDMIHKAVNNQLYQQATQATTDTYFIQHANSEEIIMKDSRYWYRFIQFNYPSEGVNGVVSISSIHNLRLINQYECVGNTALELDTIVPSQYHFLPINDAVQAIIQRLQ